MNELKDPKDRVSATTWFNAGQAIHELDRLKFAIASLAEQAKPGSFEREMADNAVLGIRCRIDYLHDSLRRLLANAGDTP